MRRRAFTLIELLVVIAIIAILAAILFPVFASAKMAAKQTVCLSNMKQIAMASLLYLGDSDDVWYSAAHYEPRPPFAPQQMWIGYDNNNAVTGNPYLGDVQKPATNPIRPGLIDAYLKSEGVKHCPNQPANWQLAIALSAFDPTHGSAYYTAHPQAQGQEYSAFIRTYTTTAGGVADTTGANDSEVEEPSGTLMAWEHGAYAPLCNFLQAYDWFDSPPNIQSLRDHFNFLHNSGTTTAWLDGHAKRIVYGQLKRPMFVVRRDIYQ
jgi:prepilin-type N-terminal cleavage/methylation domain-containing protein/prepilin-type processing-associated H-X9-DG protein